MRKNIALILAGVIIGAGLWGGIVSASTGAGSPQTIVFTDKTVKSTDVDSNNNDRFDAGDMNIFHDVLSQGGKPVGKLAGACVVTNLIGKFSAEVECNAGAKLSGGQIILAGRIVFSNAKTFKVAITGGTGSYRNASGYGVIEDRNPNDNLNKFTLYLS